MPRKTNPRDAKKVGPMPSAPAVVNHHPRLPQFPKSMGPGDIPIVNRKGTLEGNPRSNPTRSPITSTKPRNVTGSISTKKNNYRENK